MLGDFKLGAPIEPSGAYLRWGKDASEDVPGTFAKIDQIIMLQKALDASDLALWQHHTSNVFKPDVQKTQALQFNRQDAQEVRKALIQKNTSSAQQNEQKYLISKQRPVEQVQAQTSEQTSANQNSRLNHLRDVAAQKQ